MKKLDVIIDAFKEVEKIEGIKYSVFDSIKFGTTPSSVRDVIEDIHGEDSNGIYMQTIRGNGNNSFRWVKKFSIGHNVTEKQYDKIISIFLRAGLKPNPIKYDPSKAIIIER